MELNLLITFIIFNVLNVIIQTVKSIATIKCGKWGAALINAVAYGLYTYVIVYTMCDLPLWLKALIVAVANLIGVFVVKLLEEKTRKDKMWKIETTFIKKDNFITNLKVWAKVNHISYNYIDIEKYYVVNFYCPTQRESAIVKDFIFKFGGKYFVSESKAL